MNMILYTCASMAKDTNHKNFNHNDGMARMYVFKTITKNSASDNMMYVYMCFVSMRGEWRWMCLYKSWRDSKKNNIHILFEFMIMCNKHLSVIKTKPQSHDCTSFDKFRISTMRCSKMSDQYGAKSAKSSELQKDSDLSQKTHSISINNTKSISVFPSMSLLLCQLHLLTHRLGSVFTWICL